MPSWDLERTYDGPVAGVDEAGRGPAAGPVVAAAVILDPARAPDGLDDSKKLTARRREALLAGIFEAGLVGVGIAEPEEVDRANVLHAAMAAMARAVAALPITPVAALVDGDRAPPLGVPVRTIVGGDGLSLSIAAASIVAKVARDRLMAEAHGRWPDYGFCSHVGYLTAAHSDALARLGPCPIHRRSFAPVRAARRDASSGVVLR